MATPEIRLEAVQPEDYVRLAFLESESFREEEFNAVAFGPRRFDKDVLEGRAKQMATPGKKGEVIKAVKAVNSKGEIVGFASWSHVSVEEAGKDIGIYGAGKEGLDFDGKEKGDSDEMMLVANEKLCDDMFIPGDKAMAVACEGKGYHKLYNLSVAPEWQRKGVGNLLLEDGLSETDAKCMQCVLGASPEGLGLYKKHGFVVVKEMAVNLWEYEGGEGMGVTQHTIMHRPAKVS